MSILLVIAAALAALLYLLAWLHSTRAVPASAAAPASIDEPAQSAPRFNLGSLALLAGVVAHAVALYAATLSASGFRFGFAQALSGTFWVGVAMLWFEGLSVRV